MLQGLKISGFCMQWF